MTDWLIDKSALVRLGQADEAQAWADRIERGLLRISTVTRLELGFSARTADELRTGLRTPPLASMPVEYLTPAIEDRAVGSSCSWLIVATTGFLRCPTSWSRRPPSWRG